MTIYFPFNVAFRNFNSKQLTVNPYRVVAYKPHQLAEESLKNLSADENCEKYTFLSFPEIKWWPIKHKKKLK